jgi:hypothetical protein
MRSMAHTSNSSCLSRMKQNCCFVLIMYFNLEFLAREMMVKFTENEALGQSFDSRKSFASFIFQDAIFKKY